MDSVSVTVWDETEGRGPPVVFTHGIFTWATDEEYGFAKQRPLARRYRLLMMDRRGYGSSPDTLRGDFDIDAADIEHLLESLDGAHLVGHSNGGLASLLVAAKRPDLVHSLAVIQPPTFRAAADAPAVRQLLKRVEDVSVPDHVTAEDYLRGSTEGLGMTMPEPTHDRLRAVATSMRERPVWEAEVPTEALRNSNWPKLVIAGTWEDAPEMYRKYAGEALMECAESLSQIIDAELVRVPGYYPHTQQSERVNALLATLWECTRPTYTT
ncbi:alpha/beta fold hydrolase [Brevibacterium sp. UCMA 11754]|uniref:alpha/beta fold hydrolase n=1 Tax=Brevibacterium sp. UCMA 11754 TaxID=2749198 RepID=UPI001F3B0598|nr:alpha/beta hydrolase [Brevibacterium sp. UCMA 11754]MCF2573069.1 alpha/beta hydrolase [Brevibacterium sp. UCMA 11754]